MGEAGSPRGERSLSGKVALVTGASSGIGAAISVALAGSGATIVLSGRDQKRCEGTLGAVRGQGARAELITGDLTNPDFCARLVAATVAQHGTVDVLVNTAGIIHRGDAAHTPDEAWRRTMAVNLDAAFFLSRAAVRVMRAAASGGSIVNIASNVGLVGAPGLAAYCASKGALVQLTRAMALDHAREGVRVNAVCPGAVDTPMLVSGYEGTGFGVEEIRRRNAEAIPQRRVATPQEVAQLVVFLASDAACHITGTAIPIDGGHTAQ